MLPPLNYGPHPDEGFTPHTYHENKKSNKGTDECPIREFFVVGVKRNMPGVRILQIDCQNNPSWIRDSRAEMMCYGNEGCLKAYRSVFNGTIR